MAPAADNGVRLACTSLTIGEDCCGAADGDKTFDDVCTAELKRTLLRAALVKHLVKFEADTIVPFYELDYAAIISAAHLIHTRLHLSSSRFSRTF